MKNNIFTKSSFRKKVTIIFFIVALFPLLFFGIITLSRSIQNLKDNYESNSLSVLHSLQYQVVGYIQELETSMFFSLYNNSFNDELDIYSNLQSQLLYIQYLRKEHESVLYYFPSNEEVYIVNKMGNCSFFNATDMKETDWYQKAILQDNECVILPQHIQTGYDSRYEINAISTVFTICRTFKLENYPDSVLAINCYLTGLESIFNTLDIMEGERISTITADGGLLYSTDEISDDDLHSIFNKIQTTSMQEGILSLTLPSDNLLYTIVYCVDPILNITTIKLIPNNILNSYIYDNVMFLSILLIVFSSIIVFASSILSRTVTKPLSDLNQSMEDFGDGNLQVQLKVVSNDEFGKIGHTFNHMAEQLQLLIQERYTLKMSQQNAQFYSLVTQINPHFINNILQSIGSVALEKDAPEIYTASMTLAKMLRYSISKGDSVSLDDEITNVLQYLSIQKFRFEDKFEYTFQIDDALRTLPIPKLTLQPLVENALIHGIEPSPNPCHLHLQCCKTLDNNLKIVIYDDGIGIPSHKLTSIKNNLLQTQNNLILETTSIGLTNVYQRLKILFGDLFEFDITSIYLQGTQLTLIIPITKEIS
ncbi:MAG: histidine kinase [Eubacteriales bacterium]